MTLSPWKTLFCMVAKEAPNTCAYWKMKNGAEFYMIVPDETRIFDDRFAASIEFPFTFDDIESLAITSVEDVGKHSFVNNLERIRSLIPENVRGLTCMDEPGAIRIVPEVSPQARRDS
jgi:hypothetical protein